jgi:deoxyribonuclease-4
MADELHPATCLFDASDEYRPEPPPPPEPPFWKDGSIRIGIHTSIAGDLTRSLETAHGLGANALQIFSASPRMWVRGNARIADVDAKRFRDRRAELRLGPLAIHANYLINLGSPNPVLRAQSTQAFYHEIVRAIALGADFLIVHPGSAIDGTKESAIAAIGRSLRQSVRGLKLGDLQILLENTAGQGTCVGSQFHELRAILNACADLPLGVCIDTAHLFASGCDIRKPEGLGSTLDAIDSTIGLARVPVFHVNDSKAPFNSRVDRHEHIGKGKIGLAAFEGLLNHPRLGGKAFLLETPIDKPGDDRRNVATLWKLVGRTVRATGKADGMKPRRKRIIKAKAAQKRGLVRAAARRAARPKTGTR